MEPAAQPEMGWGLGGTSSALMGPQRRVLRVSARAPRDELRREEMASREVDLPTDLDAATHECLERRVQSAFVRAAGACVQVDRDILRWHAEALSGRVSNVSPVLSACTIGNVEAARKLAGWNPEGAYVDVVPQPVRHQQRVARRHVRKSVQVRPQEADRAVSAARLRPVQRVGELARARRQCDGSLTL